ncbi:MAG TPA: dTDP-4-dehydrorhamnose 3,5-epimerase [Edaphocola sp.]|nr:dTDP-4-dehydrorhamnose 3,5-epimerase [Edaphocola sp.]
MKAEETKLKGCFLLTPTIYKDERGYFFESFNKFQFESLTGADGNFVQDNQSFSVYGTIRGLHFQKGTAAQSKLVRVIKGEVLDVAVDLRPESNTYLQWVGAILNEENQMQLYIPKGFAHGFSVLSEQAIVMYKCDNYYNKEAEGGIRYDDPKLRIDWLLEEKDRILSEKDLILPHLKILQ